MLRVKIVMSFWKIAARFGIAADTTLLPKAIHSVAIAAVAVIVLREMQIGCISKAFSTFRCRDSWASKGRLSATTSALTTSWFDSSSGDS